MSFLQPSHLVRLDDGSQGLHFYINDSPDRLSDIRDGIELNRLFTATQYRNLRVSHEYAITNSTAVRRRLLIDRLERRDDNNGNLIIRKRPVFNSEWKTYLDSEHTDVSCERYLMTVKREFDEFSKNVCIWCGKYIVGGTYDKRK